MTIIKITVLNIVVASCVLILQVHGQNDCAPQAVTNITISANATLWWEVDPDEPCEITAFKVDIEGDREEEYHLTIEEDFIDLSFLEVCERWRFRITPISHEKLGYARILTAHIPIPAEADLSLNNFRFMHIGNVVLYWGLTDQTLGNCTLTYRLTIEDLDRGTMEDRYLEGNSASIEGPSPCIAYQLTLRAVNIAHPIIEGPLRRMNFQLGTRIQRAPTVKSVLAQATSVTITWTLEGDGNRCPLRNIHVDGGDYFNFSLPLHNVLDPTTAVTEITSLKPNSMYSFRVSVENSGGWSPSAHVAVQTLPLVSD